MAGKVILIGAGPGDAGLLTVKGRRELERAEVVVYDRLVDEDVMRLIPRDAERVDVGKRVADHPVPQHEINRILLEKALAGKRVVRLKGGDSFVFGRGGEELELLKENGVEFEVVPGITSALAAPAYAGIPATHRDFCASVHVITGHRRGDGALGLDYDALVRLDGTLIFLMAVRTFGEIARGLIGAGMPADFPCAIVENGTRPEQRKWLTEVSKAAECVAREGVRSPAIFVVGRVCALSERMDWFSSRPLRGCRVMASRGALAEMLREKGARVEELPAPAVEPVDFTLPPEGAAILLPEADAVEALFAALDAQKLDARALAGHRVVCSPDAAQPLRERGIRPDEILRDNAAEFAQENAVLLCREDRVDAAIARPAWRIRFDPSLKVDADRLDFVALFAAKEMEAFLAAAQGEDLSRLCAVCADEETARLARHAGMRVVQAMDNSLSSMVESVEAAFRKVQ